MVGIVIVSHSIKIAEGIKELASQMAAGDQSIFAVGGTETGEIGTDPVRIQETIEKADQGEGIVVFADLGSAIMSIGVAKEMLNPTLAKRVYLANAPIVEGVVAAAVEASLGSSCEKVLQTAQDANKMDKSL
ncbi:dihydroxyacetone kinase phosphoryl donor subunit DhaM [Pectinatus sottacetonis]|uniref:dihydroxyacetone kinase phosphoryl donor subunit DhaM n=1 Tax=Pectinatus sottacetonis TaxID=1002795 RepID=UPI0018C483C9|nr:dihydroxyacetone kinase phosphoryl donor subunit DhaM [Pectinatus sottacetonis]